MFCVCPGWCRTDMGGKFATSPPEHGAISTLKVIFELPFKKDP